VVGHHTYVKSGSYPVVVTVTDQQSALEALGKKIVQSATTAYNVSQTARKQVEPTIAVDPTDPTHQRLFTASGDLPLSEEQDASGFFAAYSLDCGKTWIPSNLRNDHLLAKGNGPTAANGDVRAVFDKFGNLFVTYLNAGVDEIVVLFSGDHGKTFSLLDQ